jgi:hypothetical protein
MKIKDELLHEFEEILRDLTVEKKSICNAMTFCMDFAESSSELVLKIYQSLMLDLTP